MKTILRFLSIAILGLLLGLTSCKKSDTSNIDSLDAGTEMQQLATDESSMHSESDNMLNDINTVMESSPYGKVYPIKGCNIDDSTFANEKLIVINYNGDNADGTRNRSGKVTMQLITGSKWTDMGATIKIVYSGVMVTRKANGKSCEFNGTFYLQNVTGGKVNVASSVVHKYWGESVMIFDRDGASRTWNINRKRTFTSNAGVLTIQTEGDTTVNGNSNVLAWGSTRNQTAFYTIVSTPIIVSSSCTNGPVQGVKVHKGLAKDATVTFGVDESGDPVSSGCAYGFKVEWTNRKGESKSAIKSY